MYLLILLGCWLLYKQWNQIPVFEHELHVEALKVGSTGVISEINYQIPISTTLAKHKDSAIVDIGFQQNNNHRQLSHRNSPVIDSLNSVYKSHFPDSLSFTGNLYYSSSTELLPLGKVNFNTVKEVEFSRYFHFGDVQVQRYGMHNKVTIEAYINAPIGGDGQHIYAVNSPSMTKPRFWSLRDISQAYYKIRIHTHSVDSVRLAFQTSGAIEISPMRQYQPELISGDKIVYGFVPNIDDEDNYKISSTTGHSTFNADGFIAPNEILFHIKYKDLENSQSRRVFLITAIISALVTVLIAFMIIFIYRAVVFVRNSMKQKPFGLDSKEEAS